MSQYSKLKDHGLRKSINNLLVSEITLNKFSNHESLLNGYAMRGYSPPPPWGCQQTYSYEMSEYSYSKCEHTHSQGWREPNICWARRPYLFHTARSGAKSVWTVILYQAWVAVSNERANSTPFHSTPMPQLPKNKDGKISYFSLKVLRTVIFKFF